MYGVKFQLNVIFTFTAIRVSNLTEQFLPEMILIKPHIAISKLQKALNEVLGTAVAQWLRYCVTNRKVAGSIPDGVIGIFH
jgi:hypothetical protein